MQISSTINNGLAGSSVTIEQSQGQKSGTFYEYAKNNPVKVTLATLGLIGTVAALYTLRADAPKIPEVRLEDFDGFECAKKDYPCNGISLNLQEYYKRNWAVLVQFLAEKCASSKNPDCVKEFPNMYNWLATSGPKSSIDNSPLYTKELLDLCANLQTPQCQAILEM